MPKRPPNYARMADAIDRSVLERDARNRRCMEAGTHPTPSGQREWRTLGGQRVLMERCKVCSVLYPADGS
jgi:hypothetical protein